MSTYTLDVHGTALLLGSTLVLAGWWVYLMTAEIAVLWPTYPAAALEQLTFLLLGLVLIYGSTIYLLTRLGRLKRLGSTRYPHPPDLDRFYYDTAHTRTPLTVLIPSYREERRVIEMTMLSAALLEYDRISVVLLLDDPVSYADPTAQAYLEHTKTLAPALSQEFRALQDEIEDRVKQFHIRWASGTWQPLTELHALADTFVIHQRWFERRQASFAPQNHAEHFFVQRILTEGQRYARAVRDEIYALQRTPQPITPEALLPYYRKARSIFSVEFSIFQRKQYANLSHEPNKAMNLNSYIGLMGASWDEAIQPDGTTILTQSPRGALTIPAAEYIITLDADSLLTHQYAKRLIHVMEQPGNEHIAVAQTPYNTFRSPFIDLEHIAGATTDIQHFVHQGFEYCNASFWVGANALLRVRALDAIKELDEERGYPITRYVQDRTVIEDTESSIDLVQKGWKIYNYLDQLAYSATPPDFGSLLIQRRRWANGGLIIFPKLVRYLFTGHTPFWSRLVESFVRMHYLLSTALVSVGVTTMIIYPFSGNLFVGPLIMIAGLYFAVYGRDLLQLGYRLSDLPRVYALNLLLLAVNVAGTLKSIEQLVTKRKIPFGRTPKVAGRTATPLGFIFAEFGILFYMLGIMWFDLIANRYEHLFFLAFNALFLAYACTRYIGWRNAYEDIRVGIAAFRTDRPA